MKIFLILYIAGQIAGISEFPGTLEQCGEMIFERNPPEGTGYLCVETDRRPEIEVLLTPELLEKIRNEKETL